MANDSERAPLLPEGHPYVPPGPGDSRSPCPGLNILANHGYLPHDGKKLGPIQLMNAIRSIWNISIPLAFILSFGGVLRCGSWFKVDLAQLALHNAIEHDASLVRLNALPGAKYAPTDLDPTLISDFMSESSLDPVTGQKVYTIETFGKILGKRLKESAPGGKLDFIHDFIGRANPAMILLALGGKSLTVPQETLEAFLAQERMPDDYVKPKDKVGLLKASKIGSEIKKAIPKD